MKELKEKIEAQKGKDYPAGGQKLIYAGVCSHGVCHVCLSHTVHAHMPLNTEFGLCEDASPC